MGTWQGRYCRLWVALLAEGVGRNSVNGIIIDAAQVALLAEGVGRNTKEAYLIHYDNKVALLAEGVGRN